MNLQIETNIAGEEVSILTQCGSGVVVVFLPMWQFYHYANLAVVDVVVFLPMWQLYHYANLAVVK